MKRAAPFVALAIAGALVVRAWMFSRTDEELVRAGLRDIAEAIAPREAGEAAAIREARIARVFADAFAPDVSLAVPELGPRDRGRPAAVALASAIPRDVVAVGLDLDRLAVHFDDSHDRALVVGPVRLLVSRQGGARAEDERTVSIRLDREGGRWRITNLAASARDGVVDTGESVAPLRPRDP